MLKQTSSLDMEGVYTELEVIAKSDHQLSFPSAAGRMAVCSMGFVELR